MHNLQISKISLIAKIKRNIIFFFFVYYYNNYIISENLKINLKIKYNKKINDSQNKIINDSQINASQNKRNTITKYYKSNIKEENEKEKLLIHKIFNILSQKENLKNECEKLINDQKYDYKIKKYCFNLLDFHKLVITNSKISIKLYIFSIGLLVKYKNLEYFIFISQNIFNELNNLFKRY